MNKLIFSLTYGRSRVIDSSLHYKRYENNIFIYILANVLILRGRDKDLDRSWLISIFVVNSKLIPISSRPLLFEWKKRFMNYLFISSNEIDILQWKNLQNFEENLFLFFIPNSAIIQEVLMCKYPFVYCYLGHDGKSYLVSRLYRDGRSSLNSVIIFVDIFF